MYTRAHTQVCHIPTDQVMVLKLNKRMTGMKKLKEVELLKKLHHPNILRYEYVWYTDSIASLLTYAQ